MFASQKKLWLLAAVVCVTTGVLWVLTRATPDKNFNLSEKDDVASERDSSIGTQDSVIVGGVKRAATDVELLKRAPASNVERPIKPHGYSPEIAEDTNPQVKLVAEALKTRTNPERFSSFVIPNSFDRAKFEELGREYSIEYAKVVEPGRVFKPANPGQDVHVLSPASNRFHRVKQGESVRLQVKAVADSPVTFTSFDLGQFENQLTSTTVVASGDGSAEAVFTATGGTIDEVQILAASPVSTGQVTFYVSVRVGG